MSSFVRTTTAEQLAQTTLSRNNTLAASLRPGLAHRIVDDESRPGIVRANVRPITVRDRLDAGEAGTSPAPEINLRPATPPNVELTPRLRSGAESFARNLDRAVDNVALSRGVVPRLRNIDEMSADQLLAEFLKVNINDPNNSVETHNKLYELASKMRQMAIEEAQQKIKVAQELMREAQALADKVAALQSAMGIMSLVAGMMGPMGAIIAAAGQIMVAQAELQATNKMLDAKEMRNSADRFKLMADMHQDQVKEQGEIMKLIMESKNQTIDAVMQMMNASFASQQKLLSAMLARG